MTIAVRQLECLGSSHFHRKPEVIVRRHLRFKLYLVSLCGAFLLLSSLHSFAQKTVVQDAGPGVKQEFDYDAEGRIVEIRTVGTLSLIHI